MPLSQAPPSDDADLPPAADPLAPADLPPDWVPPVVKRTDTIGSFGTLYSRSQSPETEVASQESTAQPAKRPMGLPHLPRDSPPVAESEQGEERLDLPAEDPLDVEAQRRARGDRGPPISYARRSHFRGIEQMEEHVRASCNSILAQMSISQLTSRLPPLSIEHMEDKIRESCCEIWKQMNNTAHTARDGISRSFQSGMDSTARALEGHEEAALFVALGATLLGGYALAVHYESRNPARVSAAYTTSISIDTSVQSSGG